MIDIQYQQNFEILLFDIWKLVTFDITNRRLVEMLYSNIDIILGTWSETPTLSSD